MEMVRIVGAAQAAFNALPYSKKEAISSFYVDVNTSDVVCSPATLAAYIDWDNKMGRQSVLPEEICYIPNSNQGCFFFVDSREYVVCRIFEYARNEYNYPSKNTKK